MHWRRFYRPAARFRIMTKLRLRNNASNFFYGMFANQASASLMQQL